MNSKFYRQLYLEHNWGNNKFAMIGELLDTVSVEIKNPTEFWNNIKSRSFVALCKKKELPVEIVRRIIMHI